MTAKRWNGSSYTDLTTFKRWSGSAWVDLTVAKRWNGTTWEDIPGMLSGSLSATLSSSNAFGLKFDPEPAPPAAVVTTTSVTVTPQGGTGSGPTYLWQRVSGDTSITVSNSTAATVSFSAIVSKFGTRVGVWRCTVTRGAESVVLYVNVALDYSSDL